jgi:ammonia channel protein AmtB
MSSHLRNTTLAAIILIAAGIYVVVKRKIQASSSFLIQGRSAVHVGIAFILGGVLAVVLPMLLGALGLVRDFVGGLVLSIATMFASLVYVAVVIVREKRRQAEETSNPSLEDRSKI